MIDKRVVIDNGDGTVAILIPAPAMFDSESRDRALVPELADKTEEEVLDWIIAKDVPEGKSHRVTTVDNLPFDRYFRNAWTDDNDTDTVDINVEKAKEIQTDKLRQLRKPLLEALDLEFMRALEKGQSTAEIVAKKQELRDVTTLELPDDPEQLKEFIPAVLKESK